MTRREFTAAPFAFPKRARAATPFSARFRKPNPILPGEAAHRDGLNSWVEYGVTAQISSITRREFRPALVTSSNRAGAPTISPVRFRRSNAILVQEGSGRGGLHSWVEYGVSAQIGFIARREFMPTLISCSNLTRVATIVSVRFRRSNSILVQEGSRRDGLHSWIGYGVSAHREFVPAPFVSPKGARAATIFSARFRSPSAILAQEGARRDGLNSWVEYGVTAQISSITRGEFRPTLITSSKRTRAATIFSVRLDRPNGGRSDEMRRRVEYGASVEEAVR